MRSGTEPKRQPTPHPRPPCAARSPARPPARAPTRPPTTSLAGRCEVHLRGTSAAAAPHATTIVTVPGASSVTAPGANAHHRGRLGRSGLHRGGWAAEAMATNFRAVAPSAHEKGVSSSRTAQFVKKKNSLLALYSYPPARTSPCKPQVCCARGCPLRLTAMATRARHVRAISRAVNKHIPSPPPLPTRRQ